jgi:hypothetical protein
VRVAQLVSLSADWDFRRKLFDRGERHQLTEIEAEVNGKVLDETMIAGAAAALGLAGTKRPAGPFTHITVLGGMAGACLNRAHEAARRLAEERQARTVCLVTAHRPLAGAEQADSRTRGWGELALESEAAVAAMRDVFSLPDHPDAEEVHWWKGDVPPVPDHFMSRADSDVRTGSWADEWPRRNSWAYRRWDVGGRTFEVAATPSSDPLARRTDTPDQLAWWSERVGVGPDDDVLLVTTDHYVPAQHFHGLWSLGLARGCGVGTCSVEWEPKGPYRGAAYLQEVRSALLAAQRLMAALVGGQ